MLVYVELEEGFWFMMNVVADDVEVLWIGGLVRVVLDLVGDVGDVVYCFVVD